jgi:hypothetical protein
MGIKTSRTPHTHLWLAMAVLVVTALSSSGAWAQVTVSVRDDNGLPISNGFRWLLEEDGSYGAVPGVASPNSAVPGNPSFTLGVNIHHSHARTVCAGDTAPANNADTFPPTPLVDAGPSAASVTITASNCPGFDASKKYLVSVLPWHSPSGAGGYMMSGRNIAAGQSAVTVVVHQFPMPTAQITVLVFADTQPINAAFDGPAETGLPGFTIIVSDAIDKVTQDAFANPLGTTYAYACTMPNGAPAVASVNAAGTITCPSPPIPLRQSEQPTFQLDAGGAPVVDFLGDGTLKSCPGNTKSVSAYTPYEVANCLDPYTRAPLAVGEAVVRYLTADKYTIEPVPPGNDPNWLLTGTLEGTRGNDAWVRASEPRYNITLGQLNWVSFFGFVKPVNKLPSMPSQGARGTITGQVVYVHDMHPPLSPGLSAGLPVPNAYVGLNNLSGNDEQVYTAPAHPATGQFVISGVPPGTYQLVMFDKQINSITEFRTITVGAGQTVALGPVAVFGWFGTLIGTVFNDTNANGIIDGAEKGISGVPVNLHFTDGSLYGTATTDADGNYAFPNYFAWWRYVIADVGFNRFKHTGATAYVDNGGPLPRTSAGALTGFGLQGMNPQIQPDNSDHRTQLPTADDPAVTQAVQTFQDMTNRIDWGKTAWAPGENGGIHGIVNYALTRTEMDPALSAIDPWEPSVPRVSVTLHKAKRDLVSGNPISDYWVIADTGPFPLTTTTDSWDDHQPTGCVGSQGVVGQGALLWSNPENVNGFPIPSCAETFYNWNQIRPGVVDGNYWFRKMPDGSSIPPGNYIVQVTAPPGYEVLRWSDRNIDVGDPKTPYLTQPPPCVGAPYDVPPWLRLYPDQQVPTDIPGGWDAKGNWTFPKAAACDMKYIGLNPGANPEVDFNIFTWVPKGAHIWGAVFNDVMLEFNPKSPNASGNFGVPWLPVSIKDWAGVEVARVYTDQWGHFDGLVPANYDIVPPIPLGLVLAMYTIAPNDPGPILDTRPGSPTIGQYITDPYFDPEYSQWVIRENWDFYSGKTTFIDTIVLPVGAFVGNRVPLNCDYTNFTPEIRQVSEVIIPQSAAGYPITITSVGTTTAPNPNYDPTNPASPATVTWDHGFGAGGTVTVGGAPVPVTAWAVDGGSISVTIPQNVSGQLVVTRGDNGLSTTVGVTLHAASPSEPVIRVTPPAPNCVGVACGKIQKAVNDAPPGTIIVIAPGTYQENVNVWKPVTLQGLGAAVTILDGLAASRNFALKEAQFNQILSLQLAGSIGTVPNQVTNFTAGAGAGVMVAGCTFGACPQPGNDFSRARAQIDGLTITGASEDALEEKAGGGILLAGYAANVTISNNEIFLNQGPLGGGIRSGEPGLVAPGNVLTGSFNPGLTIDHNRISQNGSVLSGAGGIALYAGTDKYAITNNMICGNYSAQYGGAIGVFGLSTDGKITDNKIVSNESFDEGGGLHIGGENIPGAELPLDGTGVVTGLSPGAGSVVIARNLIQGNKGGDDGGAIRTRRFNGQDVFNNRADPSRWYSIDILDNLIINNSSGDSGGGIALDDTINARIIGNTIAYNDTTGTSSDSFGGACTENSPAGQMCPSAEAIGGLSTSIPAAAGIASQAHTNALFQAMTRVGAWCGTGNGHTTEAICSRFSNPTLINDILWQNRIFYWNATANNNLGGLQVPTNRTYWDLAVYGLAGQPASATCSPTTCMTLTNSILTDGVGANPNAPDCALTSSCNLVGANPLFIAPYLNVYQATSKGAALGNFVVATFTPNGIQGDYHIGGGSPAVRAGSAIPPGTTKDVDGQSRASPVDIGADQITIPLAPVASGMPKGSLR